jgi:uncharacterized protein YbjT (DUF2867 family)
MNDLTPKVFLTGTSGFIGGRLLRDLSSRCISTRCLIRPGGKLRKMPPCGVEPQVTVGDLLQPDTLGRALEGIETAYYLVHSMGGRSMFQYKAYLERDMRAARNFIEAADGAGVNRIIYLGGMGEMADNLSEHLRSRQKVAQILQSGRVQTTVLRAANIIGAGGTAPRDGLPTVDRYQVPAHRREKHRGVSDGLSAQPRDGRLHL